MLSWSDLFLFDSICCPAWFCLHIAHRSFYAQSGPVQDHYQDDRRIWNAMFEIASQDLAMCERDGVYVGGSAGRIYPICLANKGDWSYLVFLVGFINTFCLYTSFVKSSLYRNANCGILSFWLAPKTIKHLVSVLKNESGV